MDRCATRRRGIAARGAGPASWKEWHRLKCAADVTIVWR
jgi:hypothetical protein